MKIVVFEEWIVDIWLVALSFVGSVLTCLQPFLAYWGLIIQTVLHIVGEAVVFRSFFIPSRADNYTYIPLN